MAAGQAQRRIPVAGLGHDLDVRLGLEDHPEPRPDQRLIVRDQDAQRPVGHEADGSEPTVRSSGSHARTAYPPPTRGPASSVPPTRDARSRMPTRPRPVPC